MKTDRRVKYTQKVLKESLLEILQERPIERVTVKEICDRADINRSTFYVHYGSPQDLLDSIIKEMYDEIMQKKRDFTDIKGYMTQICEIMYEYRDLMLVIIKAGNMTTMFQIADLWKDDFLTGFTSIDISRERKEVIFLYITCGAFSVIVSWAIGGFKIPLEKLADEVYKLTIGAIENYFKEEDK